MKKLCFLLIGLIGLWSCNEPEQNLPNTPPPVVQSTPYPFATPTRWPRPFDSLEVKQMTLEGVYLGRVLFYDKRLSKNNTISCASCHKQEKAFSDPAAKSIGINNQLGVRNSMGLFNLAWVDRFFWDGRSADLEQQVLVPIQDPIEMHSQLPDLVNKLSQVPDYGPLFTNAFGTPGINDSRIASALSQFLRSLVSSNSKFDRFLRGQTSLSMLERQGERLFYQHPDPRINRRGANCGDCHTGVLQTDNSFKNNGLDFVYQDNGLFNVTNNPNHIALFRVPSLRNIALTAPYMHDGRFATLEEVLDQYNDHVKRHQNIDPLMFGTNNPEPDSLQLMLTANEKAAIIAFLHTLTDSTFINNPAHANPNFPLNP